MYANKIITKKEFNTDNFVINIPEKDKESFLKKQTNALFNAKFKLKKFKGEQLRNETYSNKC